MRWSREERTLPGVEVDSEFTTHPDMIHVFAFTTDRMEVGEHAGKLSFKTVTHGQEVYRLGNRSIALRPGQVLLVNEGQSYASAIDEPGTRSISFFLPTDVAREAAATSDPLDRAARTAEPEVLQVPFRPSKVLDGSVRRLSTVLARPGPLDPIALEAALVRIATEALGEATGLVPKSALSDRVRRGTREELIARVLRARDLIHDTHGRVTLDLMAAEADLSKYHFLRTFESVFGTTPARFARRVRLRRGRERLRRGDPPSAAARAAGYRSASSFLRALRQEDRGSLDARPKSQLLHDRAD